MSQFCIRHLGSVVFILVLTTLGCGRRAAKYNGSVSGFWVGGAIAGLDIGEAVILQNNQDASFPAQGSSYHLPSQLPTGQTYAIAVVQSPDGKICTVQNPSGTVAQQDIVNVSVTCSSSDNPLYNVGGSISGLADGEQLVLQNAGGASFSVAGTSYTLSQPLAAGAQYSIQIVQSPSGKTCTIANASGSVTGTVTNADITCAASGGGGTGGGGTSGGGTSGGGTSGGGTSGGGTSGGGTVTVYRPVIQSAVVSTGAVALTWSNSGNPASISIDVRRGIAPYGETNYVVVAHFTNGATTFTDNTVVANTTYRYRIRANHPTNPDLSGVSDYREVIASPMAPVLASATASSAGVALSWSNNGNPASIAIDVRRAISPYGEANYVTVAHLTNGQTSFVDTTVAAGTTYRYRIRADHPSDANANSVSNYIDVSTGAALVPLNAPVIASATPSSTGIALVWSNSGNPLSITIDVRRAVYPFGEDNYVTVARLTNGATTFNDTTVSANTTYRYRIRANHPTDPAGNGVSAYKEVISSPNKPVINSIAVGSTTATLSFSSNNPTSIAISVMRALVTSAGVGSFTEVARLTDGSTTFRDSGLARNTRYRYRIRANHPTDSNANVASDYKDITTLP